MRPLNQIIVLIIGILSLFYFETAKAQDAVKGDVSLDLVGDALLAFLVLSIVFEVALTPIFNWRIFLKHFESKGWKTPITVGLAFIVFWSYELDVVRDLLVALGYSATKTVGGQILTALLIAGGSDGVFRIFAKLNIRDPADRARRTAEARRS